MTGGTKGVGEAIVRRFQLSGALVATTARAPSLRGQAANLSSWPEIALFAKSANLDVLEGFALQAALARRARVGIEETRAAAHQSMMPIAVMRRR